MRLQQTWLVLSGAIALSFSLPKAANATDAISELETAILPSPASALGHLDAEVKAAPEPEGNAPISAAPLTNHPQAESNLDDRALSTVEYLATGRNPLGNAIPLSSALQRSQKEDPETDPKTTVEREHRQPITLASLPPASKTAADLIQPHKHPPISAPLASSSPALSVTPSNSKLKTQNLKLKTPSPLPPRVGVGYNGAGYEGSDSFGRLEGFVPLRQNPGRNITFLEGRILLNNEAHLGANAILGHRAYSPKDNRIYGGYLAYDNRNTSHKFFQQLGLGFESLGEVWDIRTNAYIPIGDTRQQVDVSIFDTGLQVTGTRFSGHNLLFNTFRQRSEERRFEAAVFSFDIEGGGRIAKLGSQGDLRLYGGPYYYSAPEGESVVGWRTRLVARPSKYLNLSLGMQTDGLFGTNLLFQIGAAFPSSRGKRAAEEPTLLARMGDFVERNPSIVIDQQQTTNFFQESLSILARNPTTGEPWFFNHVTLGSSNGDGTFETPFGTVAGALGTIPTDGNGIVYVAQGSNPGIPAFTIPDNVQVLSRGPVQTIPVQSTLEPMVSAALTSPLQLPFSGNGKFPLVTDTVTLGSNTVLSGFTVTVDGGPALVGRNLTDATVRDNFFTSTHSTTHGIILENISGLFSLSNSTVTITNATNSGIRIADSSGTVNLLANAGSRIAGSGGSGIEIGNGTGATAVSGFEIEQANAPGILAQNSRNLTLQNHRISTTGNDAAGIRLSNPGGTVTIANNQIATTDDTTNTTPNNANFLVDGAHGIEIDLSNASLEQATISGNTITTQGTRAVGILTSARDGGTVRVEMISGNTVTTRGNFAPGIYSRARSNGGSASIVSSTISGNSVFTQGNFAYGIFSHARSNGGSASIASATISGNTVTTQGNTAHSIYSNTRSNGGSASIASATISGNSASTQGNAAQGIYSSSRSAGGSASLCTTLSGNTATTQGANADAFRFERVQAAGTATLQIVDTGAAFPTTQTNNTAIALGGGSMPFNFVDGTGDFSQVTSCP